MRRKCLNNETSLPVFPLQAERKKMYICVNSIMLLRHRYKLENCISLLSSFHCTTRERAEYTLAILETLKAWITKPATSWNVLDSIARLMDTDVTRITEHHLI